MSPHPATAADDLGRIATEKACLRDFLIGLTPNLLEVTQDTLDGFARVEETIDAMLLAAWQTAQQALRAATEEELAEADLTHLGRPLASYFIGVDPATFQALVARSQPKRIRRVPTNPVHVHFPGGARCLTSDTSWRRSPHFSSSSPC